MWLLLLWLVDYGDLGGLGLAYLGFWSYRNWYLEHVISLEFFSIFKIQGQISILLKGSCGARNGNGYGRLSDDVDKNVASYKKITKSNVISEFKRSFFRHLPCFSREIQRKSNQLLTSISRSLARYIASSCFIIPTISGEIFNSICQLRGIS